MKKIEKESKKETSSSLFITNDLTSAFNMLSKIIIPVGNTIIFEEIDELNSFELINEIITSFKLMQSSNKDNKKSLLLELFQSYFLNSKSFKRYQEKEIQSFCNIIKNYSKDSLLGLRSERAKLTNKNKFAKQFIDLLSKIKNVDEFFLNIGLMLLEKNGYKGDNLLRYVIYTLTYIKDFFLI